MAQNGNAVMLELRQKLGLSQRAIAEECGDFSAGFWAQCEQGAEHLGHKGGLKILDRYREVLTAMEISLEDLIRGYRG